ncbi:MAG TPA: YvcK family protein [Levilinea sp.]|nr:YvcK family protein [Levilinea sp.]
MRWLTPGIGIKRWIVIFLLGVTLIGIGLAMAILDVYRTAPDSWWLPIFSAASLRFLDRTLRAVIFGGMGVILVILGSIGLSRALLQPFQLPGRSVVETVSAYRRRERGPRMVAIGGGTGLSSLLRGLKAYTSNLTAVVTVADDGGSSGMLRKDKGMLPPGDIRNCLAALSNDETRLTQLFQYRFGAGAGLEGHTLGNLLITAMTDMTGSFEEAVAEAGRVLAVTGRVVPATLHDVRLVAEISLPKRTSDMIVKGESQITKSAGKVKRVWLEPDNPLAFPPAIQAILSAELIILGPGSLYTSILPNLLVPDLAEALRASRALKFYVCNVASQPGETDHYMVGDHARTIEKQLGTQLIDIVVCNNKYTGHLPDGIEWIYPEPGIEDQYSVYFADLIDDEIPWRHDSQKLAQVVTDLFYERTGPLSKDDA